MIDIILPRTRVYIYIYRGEGGKGGGKGTELEKRSATTYRRTPWPILYTKSKNSALRHSLGFSSSPGIVVDGYTQVFFFSLWSYVYILTLCRRRYCAVPR